MNYQYLNTDEMKRLEGHAVGKFNISLEQMMQNAGKAVFDVVIKEIIKGNSDMNILVLSGKGNNGGDALVTARLLAQNNINIVVSLPYPDDSLSAMSQNELKKIKSSGILIKRSFESIDLSKFDLIIDALFGFSLTGDPYAKETEIIEQINCSQIPVLSVDVPSGLDVHNGIIGDPTITANYTVALGMPKKGMKKNYEIIGKLFLGDLGIPDLAYRDMKYDPPMFRGKSYISI